MTSGRARVMMLFMLAAACTPEVQAKGFLHSENSAQDVVNVSDFQREIQQATAGFQGCGGHIEQQQLDAIEARLMPIWRSLPKNGLGRIERRLLRHLVHRYFMRKSAILIRGFEESRPAKESKWGSADILSEHLPGYVESVLLSKHADVSGFDLKDAVSTIALLEELIFESEASVLERAYADAGVSEEVTLGRGKLRSVLQNYLIRWLFASEAEDFVSKLVRRPHKMQFLMPHWQDILAFAEGQVRSFDFQRQREAMTSSRTGRGNVFQGYTMSDVHRVVGEITSSFSSYWESECNAMKMKLVDLDVHHTGRVPLSKFFADEYKLNFAESTEYLRELGALDETSRWAGPQVIIPNYIQGTNNCLVSTPHYHVCCVNFCEGLHGDIEQAVGAPVASAGHILAIVANMSEQTTVDHDHYADTRGALASQLQRIAAAHGGKVPLHGRLFAQWLHYVFPRECPFPHKAGAVVTSTPTEFGNYLVSDAEKAAHVVATTSSAPRATEDEEAHWMSQWNPEEELIAHYAPETLAPWEARWLAGVGAATLVVAVLLGAASLATSRSPLGEASQDLCKAHFV